MDLNNNFNELARGIIVLFMLGVVWYQTKSFAEFSGTLIIGFIAVSIFLIGKFLYVFLNQRDDLHRADLYILDRRANSLSVECISIWGS